MPSSVVTGDSFAAHDDPDHPESEARLKAALIGVPDGVKRIAPEQAPPEDLALVHTPKHIATIHSLCRACPPGEACYLDPETYVTRGSFDAALYAVGATQQAVEQALSGEHSFAMVRPPGHHATPDRAMGFCLFNNIAIATARALREVDRIAIVDWDLHHGNGTQAAFYTSDRVLYCSVHEMGFFRGPGGRRSRDPARVLGIPSTRPSSQVRPEPTMPWSFRRSSSRRSSGSIRTSSWSRRGRMRRSMIHSAQCSFIPRISGP